MTAPFRGVVNLDVRDSVPDWAPNVLCIVLDEWTVRRFELLRRDCRHPRDIAADRGPVGCATTSGTRPAPDRVVFHRPPRVAW